MIQRLGILLFVSALVTPASQGWATSDESRFSHFGVVSGAISEPGPVRVVLNAEWLRLAGPNQAQLRILDQHGHEVPWAVAKRIREDTPRRSLRYSIHNYEREADAETVILYSEAPRALINGLRVQTRSRDFLRHLEISASTDGETWSETFSGIIVDATSRLNFRQTEIRFPETEAPWLRIRMGYPGQESAADLNFRFGEVSLSLRDLPAERPFHIDGFVGLLPEVAAVNAVWDSFSIPFEAAPQVERGTSFYPLGVIGLPVERVEVAVSQPFFVRPARLEIRNSESAGYTIALQGVLRREPGGEKPMLGLEGNLPFAHDARLALQDQDNPPLMLENVLVSWHRRELVFLAEPEVQYRLLAGVESLPAPRYDLHQWLGTKPSDLESYPQFLVDPAKPNPSWIAPRQPWFRPEWSRPLLSFIVVLLALMLGWWIWKLLHTTEPPK